MLLLTRFARSAAIIFNTFETPIWSEKQITGSFEKWAPGDFRPKISYFVM